MWSSLTCFFQKSDFKKQEGNKQFKFEVCDYSFFKRGAWKDMLHQFMKDISHSKFLDIHCIWSWTLNWRFGWSLHDPDRTLSLTSAQHEHQKTFFTTNIWLWGLRTCLLQLSTFDGVFQTIARIRKKNSDCYESMTLNCSL